MAVGGLDLALEQVVLVEQQADLEGDLGVELGDRDRVGRGGLEPLRLGRRRAGDGRARRWRWPGSPSGGACAAARWRDPEDLPGGPAGRVVEQLAELREAELDQADEALADLRLLGHQGHREAGRLAQLDTGERVAGGRCVAHGHLGEAPRIGRIGLRAGEPAPGKVLRRERVDHRDRDLRAGAGGSRAASSNGPRTPSSRGRPARLALEPGVEGGEAGPVLADPQDLAVGLLAGRPGSGPRRGSVRRCRCRPSSPGISLPGHQRVPARSGRRQLMGPITGPRRRIPITVHGPKVGGRTLAATVICRIAGRRSPRGGRCHHRPSTRRYIRRSPPRRAAGPGDRRTRRRARGRTRPRRPASRVDRSRRPLQGRGRSPRGRPRR